MEGNFRNHPVRLALESYDFLDEDEDEESRAPAPAPRRQLAAPKATATRVVEQTRVAHKVVDEKAVKRQRAQRRRRWLLRLALVGYILVVAASCFVFAFFGCLCEATGSCGDFTLAKDIGVAWCVATGGAAFAHMYVTLPMALWIARYYTRWLALRLVLLGAVVGTTLTLVLVLGIEGQDPPPGFGLKGIPTGSALVAGFGAWLLVSASAAAGYYRNKVLGAALSQGSAYLVGCVGLGVLAAFQLHLLVGIATAMVLFFVAGWALQVWVTTSRLRLSVIAWLTPLVIGAAFGVPAEYVPERFGMPPASGYAIGLGIATLATLALSHAFETRGIGGARNLALLLLLQDAIGLASWTAGYFLVWPSGVLMATALEGMLWASITIALREGNEFGAWQGGYPLLTMVAFTPSLVGIYGQSWADAVVVGTAVCTAGSALVFLGFSRGGVLWGMRAFMITLLSFVQANVMMIELLVVNMPAPFAIGFGGVAFVLLLMVLLLLFRFDDGSGRLYGSGVEGLAFVMMAQFLTYASGLILYSVLGATDANSHMAAGLLGSLVLVCPTLMQTLAGSAQHSKANFRHGLRLAGLLAAVWTAAVLTLRFACGVNMGTAIQICSGYTIAFLLVMCLAILRYLATCLLVYCIWLATALGALALVYTTYTPAAPVAVVAVLTFVGFGLPLVMAHPLSLQRDEKRENAALDRFAVQLHSLQEMERAAKAAKPTGHRAKHVAKAKRLAQRAAHGALPMLLDLSHNGVMERAGTVRWCHSAADGRPILPFAAQTVVCRGSFLYLFAADGELLPTTRAASAIPLYKAQVLPIPEYYDDRLPVLKCLLDLRLAISWNGHSRLYLQFRSDPQMRTWAADLTRRATEDSSHSAFRESLTEQAALPDPSLAEGMLAVRKAMARAVTEREKRAVSKGITQGTRALCAADPEAAADEEMAGGSSDDPRWAVGGDGGSGGSGGSRGGGGGGSGGGGSGGGGGGGGSGRGARASPPTESLSGPSNQRIARTRIARAVRRRKAAEDHTELNATSLFSNVVCYTPRGLSGTADDLTLRYAVEKKRYPSLAASAREAAALNAEIDADELRQYNDWLAGRGPRPSDAIVLKY
jgi:uncharacterized membrane protein YgcG